MERDNDDLVCSICGSEMVVWFPNEHPWVCQRCDPDRHERNEQRAIAALQNIYVGDYDDTRTE